MRRVGVATLVWALAACSPTVSGAVTSLDVTRSDDNALRGTVRVATDRPTQVTVTLRASDGSGLRVTPPGRGREHEVPVLQVTPETDYDVEVEARDGAGAVVGTGAAGLTTGALPDPQPPVAVATSDPTRMSPGLTLFPSDHRGPNGDPPMHGILTVVDEQGRIVWYHREPLMITDVRRLDDGDVLAVYHETGLRRIAPTGELVGEWSGTRALDAITEDGVGRPVATTDAVRVETPAMHHVGRETADGGLLTLSREVRPVTYPDPVCGDRDRDDRDEGGDGSADGPVAGPVTERMAGDVVVEFDAATGAVRREWSLFDVLDPVAERARLEPVDVCASYLYAQWKDRWPVRDWTHGNSAVVDEAGNVVWVSARHLDQVLALRWRDDAEGPAGELVWRLGRGGDFRLTAGEWFYSQHAPEPQPDGSLLLYDNGNRRPGTDLDDPRRAPFSRAVRYALDTDAMTARQVWEHRFPPQEGVYAPFVGDADALPAGTVLVTHGGLLDPLTDNPIDRRSQLWTRIVEVDPTSNDIVFDLTIRDTDGEEGWGTYRAQRIPTVYPAGYRVERLP